MHESDATTPSGDNQTRPTSTTDLDAADPKPRPVSSGQWKKRASMAIGTTKFLSVPSIRSIELGIAQRVPTLEFRAWLAQHLKDNNIRTAGPVKAPTTKKKKRKATTASVHTTRPDLKRGKATNQLATTLSRQSTIKQTHGTNGERRMHTILEKVRTQVDKRTGGAVVGAIISPPMMAAMTDGMCKRGVLSTEIEAGLVIMAATQEISMTICPQGQGQSTRDMLGQAEQLIRDHQWMTQEEATTTMANAREHIVVATNRLVIFDEGMGFGGMTEGLQRVPHCTTYGVDRERQQKGTKEGMTIPDMLFDFNLGKGNLVAYTQRRARVSNNENIGMHISPNCQTQSIGQRIEAANGENRGQGLHAGKEEDPKEKLTLQYTVQSILKKTAEIPRWSYIVEQPRGSAASQNEWMKKLGQPVEARMCGYGYEWCKPTWIWTNLYPKYWTPRAFNVCSYCESNTMHPRRMIRRNADDHRPPPHIEGFTREAAKNRIHPDLAEELGNAMMRRWKEEK